MDDYQSKNSGNDCPNEGEEEQICTDEINEEIPWWRHKGLIKHNFVISGIAGRFPESESFAELESNLYSATDMITANDRRWPVGWKGLPERTGKIGELSKFDASFFSISPKQVNFMDPQMRILLEVVYEAILDAGVDPAELRGTSTGVFLGISGCESETEKMMDIDNCSGYVLTGCQRSMMANRVSYAFDFQGPSFPVDTACSSSMLALQLAVDALRQGDCDAAIVAGSHVTTNPGVQMSFKSLNMLATDGKCKSFDSSGDGYVRSETISAILLQKADVAKRQYATIVHAKSSTDGHKEAGVTVPSGLRQEELLRSVYREAGIDPNTVSYVEAHGTGTKVGDPQEAHAITQVFCENRSSPLLIGAVKSNLGHSEPSSGMSSIAKVILSMERGVIPPNLHFNEPNPYIPALIDGRLKVVAEKTAWDGGLVGINSFGFGGANTHVLLNWNSVTADEDESQAVCRLQCVAGRTEEGVKALLQSSIEHRNNKHYHALMSELSNLNPTQALYRGFTILTKDQIEDPIIDVKKVPLNSQTVVSESGKARRPVWFIYSGMGSQWPGMAKQLMHLDTFRKSIQRCSEALRMFGVDLRKVLMNVKDMPNALENTMLCMVCITAEQIALTDLLRALGIEPDGIIGHSLGEIACGYADGCLTRAQAMRIAYHRGNTIMEGGLQGQGAMAAVGLSMKDTIARLPKNVHVACHNGDESVTVSGHTSHVHEFVETLTNDDIFAKVVDSTGVAFHSPQMLTVSEKMLEEFQKIICSPSPRSDRWVSTSVTQTQLKKNENMTKFCSAEYQVNNAVSMVQFHSATASIPEDATVIEIGPSALLASVLKLSIPSSSTYIGLLRRNSDNELEQLLASFGRIHQSGVDIQVQQLYADVQFPVPRGTPQISHLIKWDHEVDWTTSDFVTLMTMYSATLGGSTACSQTFTIEPEKENSPDAYLKDHVIDGRVLYPFTGYLCLAWRCFANIHGKDFDKTEIIIEDFTVLRATVLQEQLKFSVFIRPGDGAFNIVESESPVCSGRILFPGEERNFRLLDNPVEKVYKTDFNIDSKDIYKELLLRGYEYGPEFRCLDCMSGSAGRIKWTNNWVPFLDACIQTWLLAEGGNLLKLPTTMQYMRINPMQHEQSIKTEQEGDDEKQYVEFVTDFDCDHILIGGVEIGKLNALATPLVARSHGTLVLEKLVFMPFFCDNCLDYDTDAAFRSHLIKYEKALTSAMHELWQSSHHSVAFSEDIDALRAVSSLSVVQCDEQENFDESHTLLNYINTLLKSKDPISAISIEDYSSMLMDPFFGANMMFQNLKQLYDQPMETLPGSQFRWAIAEDYPTSMLNNLAQIAMSHPRLQIKWAFIGKSATTPDDQFVENHESESLQFDLCDSSKELPKPFSEGCDIVLLNRVLSKQSDPVEYLKSAVKLLKEEAFIIVIEPTRAFELNLVVDSLHHGVEGRPSDKSDRHYGFYLDHQAWLKVFESAGFNVLGWLTDPAFCTTGYSLRRPATKQYSAVLLDVDDVETFSWLPELQALTQTETTTETETEPETDAEGSAPQKIWLHSTKTHDNGLIGLGLSLVDESPMEDQFRMIVNCELNGVDLELSDKTLMELKKSNLVNNVYRNKTWGNFSHKVTSQEKAHRMVENAYIKVTTRGDLSSASWIENHDLQTKLKTDNKKHNEVVSIYCAPLNFRDIMLATGRLPAEAVPGVGIWTDRDKLLGLEYAGRLPNGRRVMGITSGEALATNRIVDARYCMTIPDRWTMEDAATIPTAYMTCFYALGIRAKLQRGEKVLVHSGTGAVGQAAINVALLYDCEVFTTVGSEAKRKFIKEIYPQLDDNHISNSRSIKFEFEIMRATNGKGVDVVLNSLAGDKLQASVRCLAEYGRFLEIGKFDLSRNSALGMQIFLKSVTFHGILLDSFRLGEGHNPVDLEVKAMMMPLIADGSIKPLTRTVFPSDKVSDALKYMSTGNHVGKVVVKIRDEEESLLALPRPIQVNALGRTYFNATHCYIVTGGLGGFGLELTKFLIDRGAKNVILTSRSGAKTGYQKRCLFKWAEMGAKVMISTSDISTMTGATQLMEDAAENGPIGGIFHLAMVLKDAILENQSIENFKAVSDMKYLGTKNLDKCTREKCDDNLKWFIVFSSVTAGRGNAGQSAYGWGNSAMERIIEKRRYDGHCGMAIQWGAIGDVGIVMDNFGSNEASIGGTSPQRMNSCIQCLDMFMTWNHPIVSSFVRSKSAKKKTGKVDVLVAVAEILGVSDPSTLKLDTKLTDFGIDSLIGVELRQLFERDYNLILTMKEIRTMTLGDLKNMAENVDNEGSSDKTKETNTVDATEDTLTEVFKIRLTAEDFVDHVWEDLSVMNKCTEGDPVYFVHAIEGIAAPLRKLANMITAPVLCFQHTEQANSQSVETLANYYVQVLRAHKADGEYMLVGYSYGACIAFEMACQLQDAGCKVNLVMLDASPKYWAAYKANYRRIFGVSETDNVDELLAGAYFESEFAAKFAVRFGVKDESINKLMYEQASWQDRLQVAGDAIAAASLFPTAESVRWPLDSFKTRFIIADRYHPAGKYGGNITLVKTTIGGPDKAEVGDDYGLREIMSGGELTTHVVEGDHDELVQGDQQTQQVADIINRIVSAVE